MRALKVYRSTPAIRTSNAPNSGTETRYPPELVPRAYHPGRMGDLQLVLTPGSASTYAPESLSLVRRDPRSSHALPWMYLERVPIVVYAPGIVGRGDSVDRVTLADVAPTAAG